MTLYKVTGRNGEAFHGGRGKWTLNRWRSVSGRLDPCRNGLHLCTLEQLPAWLGPVIWEAEVDGELVDAGDKLVARKARVIRRLDAWNERTARLFAADCAEHVLPLFEKVLPEDDRPRKAIDVARRYANGEATDEERDASRAAAWAAARDAARDAAWDAAWDAARDAAWAAAWDAARAAAWAAERQWQVQKLAEYLT